MRRIPALVCAASLLLPASTLAAQPTAPDREAEPAPAAAQADAPAEPTPPKPAVGGDVVRLQDGSFVRGTVEEYEPQSHVVVVKSDGTRRRIAWSEIAGVDLERDRQATPPAAPSDASSAPVAEPPPPERPEPAPLAYGDVRLHIVSEGPRGETLTLYRQTGTAHAYGPAGVASAESADVVCSNPCGTPVSSTAGTYYISRPADGPILKSRPFSLAGRGPDVTARVRPGNRAAMMIGMTLMMVGVTFTLVGPTLLGLEASKDEPGRKFMVVGGALTGVGVAGLAIGIPLMVRGRNRVRLVDGRPS